MASMSDGMERQQAPLARHGRMLMRGGCHCGLLRLAFATSLPAAALAPRACDCSFCRRHGAAWLSDPDGRLDITVAGRNALLSYRQGSEAAEFRLCARCGVLVAATFTDADRLYAAVNAGCLDEAAILPPAVRVSPQSLGHERKIARWRELWIPDVELRLPT